MADKQDMEDGEISNHSDEESPLFQYNPLQRPAAAEKSSYQAPAECETESDDSPGLAEDSATDSDEESGQRPKAKSARAGYWARRDALVPEDGGGDTFKRMAQAFQERRQAGSGARKRNNVWGNFIQEESLNAEISGSLGVGKSLKDLPSDRGAETYDYTQIIKERKEEKSRMKKEVGQGKRSSLDDEMDSYWNKNVDEKDDSDSGADKSIQEETVEDTRRGTKRSAKDRLGQKRFQMDIYKNEVLPPPGTPRQIPDIAEDSLFEGTDDEFGKEIAGRLQEEKVSMIVDLIKILGRREVWNFFCKTQKVESEGGMMINNGARRRTAGGVMMHLLRTTEREDISTKAKDFFRESQKKENQRRILQAKGKKKRFEEEMTEFLNRKKEIEKEKMKEKECDMEDEEEFQEELKPLPNILSMIANSLEDKKPGQAPVGRMSSFKEPEAPPNSVERNVIDYDDDFLSSNVDTEDIELF